MKAFLVVLLLLVAMPLYGQFISVNLDKSSEATSIFTQAYRSAAANSADIDTVDSAATKNPGLLVTIQGKSPITGKYYTILTADTIFTEGSVVSLVVHPDVTAVTNLMAKDILPLTWRVNAAIVDTGAISYSVDGEPIR